MNKLSILYFSLIFLASPSFAQDKKLDSLYQSLKGHPEHDSVRVKLLHSICYYEMKIDPEKAKKLTNEALSISQNINYKKGIGFSEKYLASYFRETGDYAKASEHAFKMLKMFEGISYAKGMGQANQILGIISQENRNLDQAKAYYLKAVEIFKTAGLKLDLSFIYNSLGALNIDLKKYDEALHYQFEALRIREELKREDHLFMYANIGTTYKLSKNYSKALEFYKKELPRMETSPYRNSNATAYVELGDLYTLMGDYRNAEACLLKGLTLSRQIRHKKLIAEAYDNLTLLEKARKNYQRAFDYQALSNKYNDSIFTEENGKKLAELQVRYEAEQKDHTIQVLEDKEQISKLQRSYLIGILAGSILIFLMLYILQRFYNRKVKSMLEIQQSLNGKLQESDKTKSKFFANVSHELRTPLTLILAPIEAKLSAPRLSAADRQSFQLIRRNAKRLLSLINQLLDISKLEAQKMQMQVRKGNLMEFLTVLAASFDSLAEHRGLQFKKQIEFHLNDTWFDADKVEKIVNNLLANAIKFTPPGGLVVFTVIADKPSEIIIKVSDTGPGIPFEDQGYIFEPFYQSRHTEADGQTGTGLGLLLVREMVKLYSGTIELESVVGRGTVVTVVLPTEREKFAESAINLTPEEKTGITLITDDEDTIVNEEIVPDLVDADSILVVEDNEELRTYISSLLNKRFVVYTARDGEEGFDLAVEHIPDLILSDVVMPKRDGLELTAKLKSDERTSHIPVVLLTAKADEESKLSGLLTRADDYLAKPFSIPELNTRIDNLIDQRKRLAAKYQLSFQAKEVSPVVRKPSIDDKFLDKVKKIVDDNLGNNNFGVEQLASEVNLSRAQLFRKLKAIANFSPNELINEIRLEKAAELIRSRSDGLTQISYQVGFNEQSYFAKRFRKKFGVTPSEYQANHAEA